MLDVHVPVGVHARVKDIDVKIIRLVKAGIGYYFSFMDSRDRDVLSLNLAQTDNIFSIITILSRMVIDHFSMLLKPVKIYVELALLIERRFLIPV